MKGQFRLPLRYLIYYTVYRPCELAKIDTHIDLSNIYLPTKGISPLVSVAPANQQPSQGLQKFESKLPIAHPIMRFSTPIFYCSFL